MRKGEEEDVYEMKYWRCRDCDWSWSGDGDEMMNP